MKILVTGFKPFLGEALNPSEMLSQDLQKRFSEVQSLILPVEFEKAFLKLQEHLQVYQYSYVILLGQASGRSKIGFEKIALNWQQTEHADETGYKPNTGEILLGEKLALMTAFDVDAAVSLLKQHKKPVEVSFSAGTYVCNDLYYRALAHFNELKIVFVHVPMIKEQIKDSKTQTFIDYSETLDTLNKLIESLVQQKTSF
jgi:pyroglutamyl-peptidase